MHDHDPPAAEAIPASEFHRVQHSAEFKRLKRSFRRFAFPMTAVFLGWYLFYVLGSIFNRQLMMRPVLGTLTFGLLLGLGQFASTFIITWLYVRHSNRTLDPIAKALRDDLEGGR